MMHPFSQELYYTATEFGVPDIYADRAFRTASAGLDALLAPLADCAATVSLAYGFRLAAQILATPESCAACATAAATAGHTRSSKAAGTI